MMTVECGFVAARGEPFSSHGERVVKAGHFTMKCIFRNKSDFSKLYFRNKNWMGNQNLFYIPIPVLKKNGIAIFGIRNEKYYSKVGNFRIRIGIISFQFHPISISHEAVHEKKRQ